MNGSVAPITSWIIPSFLNQIQATGVYSAIMVNSRVDFLLSPSGLKTADTSGAFILSSAPLRRIGKALPSVGGELHIFVIAAEKRNPTTRA